MAGAKEPRMVGEGLWEPYPAKISLKMLGIVGLRIDFLEFCMYLQQHPQAVTDPQRPSFQGRECWHLSFQPLGPSSRSKAL